MILFIIGILILFMTFLRFAIALINMLSRPYLPSRSISGDSVPPLSVLIPVRNEEERIGNLLSSLSVLPYPEAEILVYDDGSTDNSASVINAYATVDRRIRYFKGTDLPAGWTGKNHACHMLASKARGEYLLFLDADVTAGHDLLQRTVSYSMQHDLTLLSIFPKQEMKTAGEKIVVPFMFRMLLSLLPLFLIRRCHWSSFSAANGQLMLFRSSDYNKYKFHEKVKDQPAEDIEIMRYIKKKGLRGDTLVGCLEITCRMYTGYSDAVNGFAKNIFSMFGNSMFFFLLFSLTGLVGWILLLLLPWYFITIYIFMVISLNVMIAITSHQKVSDALKWLLPGTGAFYHIAYLALRTKGTGYYEWKGRILKKG